MLPKEPQKIPNCNFENMYNLRVRAKVWRMYGMDSKLKLGDQQKTSEQTKKLRDLYLE